MEGAAAVPVAIPVRKLVRRRDDAATTKLRATPHEEAEFLPNEASVLDGALVSELDSAGAFSLVRTDANAVRLLRLLPYWM